MSSPDLALVGIFDLQVVIARDGEGWVAQGLEVDYAVGGDSVEDVQARFGQGLRATVQAHLERFGHLENFIVPAVRDAWSSLLTGAQEWKYTHVSLHQLGITERDSFPFRDIKFVIPNENVRVA